VSRKVALPGVQRFWEEARGKRGNVYLPQNVPATELLKVLKSGGCVTLAIDQNMPPKHGVRVPFFGREASTTFAPALLHLRTGAPIFPVFGGREPDGRYVVKALPELKFEKTGDFRADSEAITARLNSVLEDFIRSHPDQWLWMHRRWK
jgi:KDO2-lipid IV(A) lauroyltransferase